MNKSYQVVAKMIAKQMDAEQLPVVPTNRHQRRALKKVKQ